MQNGTFKMRRFGTFEDVGKLEPGHAVLLHKYLVRERYKSTRSAESGVRQAANGNGALLWVTETKRGHLLCYRKLTEPTITYTRR